MQKMQETLAQSLGWGDPLEKETAVCSSIFAWIIPYIEKPGGLLSKVLQRVRHNSATSMQTHKWYLDFWLPGGLVFLTPCCSKVNCCIQQRCKWSNLQSIAKHCPKDDLAFHCLPQCFSPDVCGQGNQARMKEFIFHFNVWQNSLQIKINK